MIDERLFANLIAYSAQVACIVALGTVLHYLLRIDVPRLRHAYWRTLLAICLLLPLLQGWEVPIALAPAPAFSGTVAAAPVLTVAMPSGRVTSNEPTDWPLMAARLIAIGFALRLLWTGMGLWRLRALRRVGEPAGPLDFAELKARLGALAEIRYAPGVEQPVTFGLLRPVIVLPEGLRDHGADVQCAVVCHELCHVKRRDWAWLLLEEGVRAALWFHPAVWWVISRIQLTREEAVDAEVVATTGQRRAYAEALMAFADDAPLTPVAAFSRRRHLFTRIVLISKEAVMSSKRIVASCMAMVVAIAAGGWLAVQAFPLQAPLPGAVAQPVPVRVAGQRVDVGPVEQQAKPVTPENPIPRRTYFVPVELSAEATSRTPALVIVRMTIDESGRVAEARFVGVRLENGRAGGPVTLTGNVSFRQNGQDILTPAVATILDTVKQWRYDPPFDGPMTFDATIPVWLDREQLLEREQRGAFQMVADRIVVGPPDGKAGDVLTAARLNVVRDGAVTGAVGAAATPQPGVPVRVGGAITQPVKTRHVNPEYPPLAQSARVQGVVILEAVINAEGRVDEARVLRSIPLLDQAAIDAVRQWEFTPTMLNGEVVPVIMTATVQFTLAESAEPPAN